MNTDDFIAALAGDGGRPSFSLTRRLALALALGASVSFLLFLALVGPRPDAAHAMRTMRFDLKFVDALALLAPSFLLCLRLARPQTSPRELLAWLLAPLALLGAGVAVELATVPQAQWMAKLIGSNIKNCMTFVPLFSLAPLAALIVALRAGAPSYPGLTGALAGAAAAGVSALFYASNCTDDSPLFVATWYPLATGLIMALGAVCGRLALRW